MRLIDVQVHAYEHNHPGRPWAGHLHGPQSATGEEMVAAMDAVGVDAAIIVSTFNLYRYDPSYALRQVPGAISDREAQRSCESGSGRPANFLRGHVVSPAARRGRTGKAPGARYVSGILRSRLLQAK